MRSLRQAGNSQAAILNRYNGLKAFLKWAIADGRISDNPITPIPLPKPGEEPIPVLTDDQVRALLTACRGSAFETCATPPSSAC